MAKVDVSKLLPSAKKTAGIVKRTITLTPSNYVPITKSLTSIRRDDVNTDKDGIDDIDEVHVREVDRVETLVGQVSKLLMSSEAFKARREERERKLLVSSDRQKKEAELEADKAEKGFNGPKLLRKIVGGNIIDAIYRFFIYTFLGAIFNSTKDIIPPLIKTFGKALDPIAKIFTSIVGLLFEGFVFFVDLGFKVHDTIRGTVKFLGGDFGVKIFDAFTSGLTTFVNTALIVGMMLASAGMMPDFGLGGGGKGKRGAAPGSRPGAGKRPPAPGARPGARPPAPGARPSRPGGPAARPGAPQVRPPRPGMPRGVGQGAGRAAGKGASKIGSKFVPFIGPIIDFALRTLVFGDSPGRAAAGAAGVAAGQALGGILGGTIGAIAGSVVPIVGNLLAGGAGALIGSVIGGFVGDAIGTALYDMIFERSKTTKPQKKATGGTISRSPARTVARTVTRRRRLKVNSKTQQKQRTEPGKDIGGKNIIQKLFPDTDSPDGGGGQKGGGVLGWAKRILGLDEQSKEKGKRGNPYKALTETSEILKKIPVVGGIMGASIDIALGQKPHDMVYNQLGESIAAIIQSAGERSSAEALRQIVSAYASGGVITETTRPATDTSSLGASLGKAFKHAIGIESAIAIRNIQTESGKYRDGSQRDGSDGAGDGGEPAAPGAPGAPEPPGPPGAPKAPKGRRRGQGGTRGAGSSPGSVQPTQPKAPGVPTPQPPGGGGGGAGGNISVKLSPNQKKALDILSKYESASSGGYNAVNQIGISGGRGVKGYAGDFRKMKQHGGKSLTDMTVGEIMALQAPSKMSDAEWIKQGRLHAVGRYQFIGNTLPGVVARAGIPHDAKFTKEVQDLLAVQYMKERGIGAWIGPADHATQAERQIVEAARKDPIVFSRAKPKPSPGSPLARAGKAEGVESGQQLAGSSGGAYAQISSGYGDRDGQDTGTDIELFGTRGKIGKQFGNNAVQGPYGNRGVEISFPYELQYFDKIPGGRNAGQRAITSQGSTSRVVKGTGPGGFGHIGSYVYTDPKDGKRYEIMMAHGNKPFRSFKNGEKIAPGTVLGWQGASGSSDDGAGGLYDHVSFHVNAIDSGGNPDAVIRTFANSLISGQGAKLTAKLREQEKSGGVAGRKPGTESVLNGKPVVWDGKNWKPKEKGLLSKIAESLAPKAAAAEKPPSTPAAKPTARKPTQQQLNRAKIQKNRPKPAAKPAPKRDWYDPRGWVGKEEGGRIAPTPSRNSFDSLKTHASYEGTDSQVMIQPVIIDNFIPMQMPSGTASFGHGGARGAGGAGLNKTYKRNSLSRH